MKIHLALLALCLSSAAFSQSKVEFEADTVRFGGLKFYAGSEFMTGSGSNGDKTFSWVYVSDEKYNNVKPLYPVYAKTKFVVEKVYDTHRGWSVQSRLPDITKKDGSVIKGEIMFFSVETAVKNKEVVGL